MISRRSKIFLAGSTLAPIEIAIFRYQFLHARQAAKNAGAVLMSFDRGLIDYGILVIGILCFASALISLIIDVLRTRRAQ
jgi:hypothetical protein